MKKISMQDIAAQLGLSITTVSFVINGKAESMGLSGATIKKVNDLIKKEGYKPNSAARVLRTGKSLTIVLIIEDISNPFFGNIARYIEIVANKNGYKVFFGSTINNAQIAKSLISTMRQGAVDGFIITPTKGLEEEILSLKKDNIPFVLIDRILQGIEVDSVVVDNFKGAYQLTQHLLQRGYSQIGFFTVSDAMSTFELRKTGYMAALKDGGINVDDSLIWEGGFGEESAVSIASIQSHLKKNKHIDAVFFAANYLGLLGIEAMQLNKLKIGRDIAMASFDDNDVFRLMTPSVTVAAQPISEIAAKAFDLLLKNINKEKANSLPTVEMIQPKIIIRNSSPKKKIQPSHAKAG